MRAAGCETLYTLEEINIENELSLLTQYRDDIPVITINGVEAFRHRLSSKQFRERLLSDG